MILNEKLDYLNYTEVNEITCPYCGGEYQDSWEAEEQGREECPDCGKVFFYRRVIDVSYTSVKATIGRCCVCDKETEADPGDDTNSIRCSASCEHKYYNKILREHAMAAEAKR